MTPTQFQKLLLSLPEVIEGAHHGHADFRLGGRVFASLLPDGERAMLKLPLDAQRALVERDPATFAPAAGVWGRAGCTYRVLANVTPTKLRPVATDAWQFAQAAAAARPAKRSPRKRSP
ncbi:MAG: MmcQ/YjbR family DNA-binding protein [Planctomycetes bacterium]|nr:MmcQ/YjbR family DNA-binding protein [Planctomycetota bacterium]